MTSATAVYELPHDIKAIYNVRLVTNNRSLVPANRRLYDRVISDQSSGDIPLAYDIFRHQNAGMIELIPPPSITDTMLIRYYRRLTPPCSISVSATATTAAGTTLTVATVLGIQVGAPILMTTAYPAVSNVIVQAILSPTTIKTSVAAAGNETAAATIGGDEKLIDIPADYENYLLAWASHHYLANRGSDSRPERVKYWAEYSTAGLDEAKSQNLREPNEDLAFMPGGGALPWPNDALAAYRNAGE